MGFGRASRANGLSVPSGAGGFTLGNEFSLEVWVKPLFRTDGHFLFDKREVAGPNFAGFIWYLKQDTEPHFEVWGTHIDNFHTTPIPRARCISSPRARSTATRAAVSST